MADPLPPAEPLPPSPPPEPTIVPRSSRSIVCEFCECTLTPAGEVLKRGEVARKHARMDERIETLEAEKAVLTADLGRVQDELRELRAASARRPLIPDLM